MRFIRLQSAVLALSLAGAAGFMASTTAHIAYAQTATTGGLSGQVLDGTGAAVPGATIIITDTSTDAKQTVATNAEGRYTVDLLKPGLYKISASAAGLQSETVQATVVIGTTISADVKVTPTGDKTIIEVTSTNLPLVDTQNVALATTFNETQIQELPTPGGDVTTVAFTAPGVVVNAGGSYGNFSSNGLPGISNLFVLNGFDNQDPFLNLNNSGSSNLTLGQGELAEATVIQNGYNSQYGRAAGAVINYTTKSGGNKFHGALDYNYNGTVLNANGWFNQLEGGTRPHAVSNEWAANAGGPIIKDKVFFFADFEGLRYVLPGTSGYLTFPSPALSSYILKNAPAAAEPFMALALNAYKKAPAYATAIPVATGKAPNQDASGNLGCGDLAGTPTGAGGTFGTDTPCMVVGTGAANNINKEWLFTGRGDWNVSDKQKIYGRYKMDRGSQPTFTSFIDPLFSALSIQPEYEGQFNDSYVVSSNKTNVFVAAANWYSAYFGPVDPAASEAELPASLGAQAFGLGAVLGVDGSGVNSFPGLPAEGVPFYLTQGRNVTQYQLEDDFSWIAGKHTLKFGANFRRDLVSDYDAQIEGPFPFVLLFGLGDFASGTLSPNSPFEGNNQWGQSFTASPTAHLALYNVGAYVQDEYQVLPKLKLTLGVRIDRTGDPLCHNSCFSSYPGSFPASGTAWNAAVNPANPHPFPGVEVLNFQPRFGFNYGIGEKTEIRGGVGIFSDLYPAGFLDGVIQNFPNSNTETVYFGDLGASGAGTTGANAAAANTAVQQGFKNGLGPAQVATSLYAGGGNTSIPFSPPGIGAYFPAKFKVPEYLEYSLQVQRQITRSSAVVVTYAGNYGYNEVLTNPYQNAANGTFGDGFWNGLPVGKWGGGGFGGAAFPVTPPDPRFGRITAYTNNAHSNYNGGMVTFKHDGHGLTGEISYTYSHSLDTVSNGGEGENFNGGSTLNQLTPDLGALNLNYSNSDYDVRNNLVGDMVYEEPLKYSNPILNNLVGGWVIGMKTYYRSGEPFSVTDAAVLGGYTNLGTSLMAELQPGLSRSDIINPTSSNPKSCALTDCMDTATNVAAGNSAAQFTSYKDQETFGTLRRNSLFGPHYADTDLSVLKKVIRAEGFTLQIGANAYNVFNHVNFADPVTDVSSGSFGQIQGAVAPPTSPYGSFQGAAVTQRVLQVHGKITF
jgi:hypothetical protein